MRDNELLDNLNKILQDEVSSLEGYAHRLEAERDYFKEKYETLKETAGFEYCQSEDDIFALKRQRRESNWEKYPDRMGK